MKLGRLIKHVLVVVGLLAFLVLPSQAPWTVVGKRATASAPKAGPSAFPHADFNGDGFADLAIGVPKEGIGSLLDAGAVHVLYGSSGGLTAVRDQFWTQDSPGVKDTAEAYDLFGEALAAGDFNGDGFADLSIGVPHENVGSITGAGAVQVLYGSSAGLTVADDQFWTQDSRGIKDRADFGDAFGMTLAAGDFNGDGFADLTVGVPGEGVGTIFYAGAIQVLYGSSAGLTAANNQFWTQDTPGMEDTAESDDWFGVALAAGDLNADGFADLAVGIPAEDVGSLYNAGAVQVLYGSSAGLTAANNQFWTQDSPNMEDLAELSDQFGYALAAGDFNVDGFGDLAVGVWWEDVESIPSAGAVHVLYGSSTGLSAANDQFWTQDSPGIEDTAELDDYFGQALAAGDFSGDGFADLAIGVAYEDLGAKPDAGAVNVLYGSAAGLSATDNQFWTQDTTGIRGTVERGDSLGWAVAAGDFSGDGPVDLAIGVPQEEVRGIRGAGAVNILYGSATGLGATNNQMWNQNPPRVKDAPELYDAFGASLASN